MDAYEVDQLRSRLDGLETNIRNAVAAYLHTPYKQQEDLSQLQAVVRQQLADVRAGLRELELVAEEQDTEDDAQKVAELLSKHKRTYDELQKQYRAAAVAVHRQAAAAVVEERKQLLGTAEGRRKHEAIRNEADVLAVADDITGSLRRTRQALTQELEQTSATFAVLDESNRRLAAARDELAGQSTLYKAAKGLLKTMNLHAMFDWLVLWGGVAFFTLVVIYIVQKRVRYFVPSSLLPPSLWGNSGTVEEVHELLPFPDEDYDALLTPSLNPQQQREYVELQSSQIHDTDSWISRDAVGSDTVHLSSGSDAAYDSTPDTEVVGKPNSKPSERLGRAERGEIADDDGFRWRDDVTDEWADDRAMQEQSEWLDDYDDSGFAPVRHAAVTRSGEEQSAQKHELRAQQAAKATKDAGPEMKLRGSANDMAETATMDLSRDVSHDMAADANADAQEAAAAHGMAAEGTGVPSTGQHSPLEGSEQGLGNGTDAAANAGDVSQRAGIEPGGPESVHQFSDIGTGEGVTNNSSALLQEVNKQDNNTDDVVVSGSEQAVAALHQDQIPDASAGNATGVQDTGGKGEEAEKGGSGEWLRQRALRGQHHHPHVSEGRHNPPHGSEPTVSTDTAVGDPHALSMPSSSSSQPTLPSSSLPGDGADEQGSVTAVGDRADADVMPEQVSGNHTVSGRNVDDMSAHGEASGIVEDTIHGENPSTTDTAGDRVLQADMQQDHESSNWTEAAVRMDNSNVTNLHGVEGAQTDETQIEADKVAAEDSTETDSGTDGQRDDWPVGQSHAEPVDTGAYDEYDMGDRGWCEGDGGNEGACKRNVEDGSAADSRTDGRTDGASVLTDAPTKVTTDTLTDMVTDSLTDIMTDSLTDDAADEVTDTVALHVGADEHPAENVFQGYDDSYDEHAVVAENDSLEDYDNSSQMAPQRLIDGHAEDVEYEYDVDGSVLAETAELQEPIQDAEPVQLVDQEPWLSADGSGANEAGEYEGADVEETRGGVASTDEAIGGDAHERRTAVAEEDVEAAIQMMMHRMLHDPAPAEVTQHQQNSAASTGEGERHAESDASQAGNDDVIAAIVAQNEINKSLADTLAQRAPGVAQPSHTAEATGLETGDELSSGHAGAVEGELHDEL